MLPSYQNSTDLLTEVANNTKLYTLLIIQLNKDFHLTGIDVTFSEDNTPSTLKEVLLKVVKKLLLHDFNSFTNLLYRIDISEKDIQMNDATDIDLYAENITFLILQRIWKKVWFKERFYKG
ncbi:hypothetical protein P8625_08430 [Tenacibaculum tangerinum]|uniref:Condensation domain-containing protein n=1 Tax=Tenacibaculum tangerinum TaxID=3038772 RepID=A0ABY8KZ77_9FLAO|nr:hypothetical protein [Tenacibaculum tangerinum]WGH74146.1 hypothetical protein P8625_08430 [Tenacibaculum tangerinum]